LFSPSSSLIFIFIQPSLTFNIFINKIKKIQFFSLKNSSFQLQQKPPSLNSLALQSSPQTLAPSHLSSPTCPTVTTFNLDIKTNLVLLITHIFKWTKQKTRQLFPCARYLVLITTWWLILPGERITDTFLPHYHRW